MPNNIRKHVDNFRTTLDESVADSDTSFDLVDASGLGTIAAGDYIPCTIDNRAGSYEIIHVYSVTGDTIDDCARGMEGTSAQNWALGDLIECRLTASAVDNKSEAVSSIYATSPGTFTVFTGIARWYPSKNIVLKSVVLNLGLDGLTDAVFNVCKNGTPLFSDPNKPTVTSGNTEGTPQSLDELITPSDYITIDCESAGGTEAVLRIDYISEEL